jgi:hypothetical protein
MGTKLTRFTMKNIVILFYLLLTFSSCAHKNQHTPLIMDSKLKEFSDRWKADSLGVDSFRIAQLFFDKNARNWIVGGYNFKGFSSEDIIKIFGKPDEKGLGKEDDCLMLTYIVLKKKTKPDITFEFYFDKNNNVVGTVWGQ